VTRKVVVEVELLDDRRLCIEPLDHEDIAFLGHSLGSYIFICLEDLLHKLRE
jgi:urease accessory protein UreE